MSTFLFDCPECGAKARYPDELQGRQLRCTKCEATFRAGGAAPPPMPQSAFDFEGEPDTRPSQSERRPASRKPTKKKMPIWIPLGIGGGIALLVVVGIIVAVAASGDKKEAKQSPTTPVAQAAPAKNPPEKTQLEKPKIEDPPSKPRDPVKKKDPLLEELEPVIVSPLPPANERPNLVLDAGGHSSVIKASLFTPDGSKLVTVSQDKTVRVWDASTGETVQIIRMPVGPGPEGAIYSAAISPDGKHLAVAGLTVGMGRNGFLIYLISLETGELERTMRGHNSTVSCLSFSQNNKWLASGSADRTAMVWKVETGELAGKLVGHTDRLVAIAFHPSNGSIATLSHDRTARIWTAKTEGFDATIIKANVPLMSLAWRRDGQRLAIGGGDGMFRIFDKEGKPDGTHGPALDREPSGKTAPLQLVGIEYLPDGSGFLYGGVAFLGRAGIWDIAAGKARVDFGQHTNTVQAVGLSKDGTLAFTTGGDHNESFVWRTDNGEVVHRIVAAGRSNWGVAWSTDSKSIYFGNINHELSTVGARPLERAFNFEKFEFGKVERGPIVGQERLGNYELRRDGFFKFEVLLNGAAHYTLKSLGGIEDRIYSATLLTGDRAIIGTGVGRLIMFDLKQKRVLREFTGHQAIVLSLAPSPDGKFFASGSNDQTVSIWKLNRNEPVLTFFPAGREWIAWTPEGYYSASANGERLMGWQISNGPDQLGTYYPAIRFRQSLFQPEVVRNLFRTGGELPQAIALAIREKRKPIGSVNITQVIPPSVTITSPKPVKGEAKTDKDTIRVTAIAKSTGIHAVRSLRLLIDGRPYAGDNGLKTFDQPKPGSVEGTWDVLMPPGSHAITVLADSGVSKGLSPPVTIVRDAKSRLPNLYVFAVGVSAYPGRLKLQWAATDAENITGVLKSKTKGVFGNVDVRLLTDKEGSKTAIEKGLDWLQEKMTWEDVGVFYFSGHGGKDDDDTFYLIPQDLGRDTAATCVAGDFVKKRLAAMPGKLVAILDACHSGSVAETFKAGGADGLVRDLVGDEYGVIVMCSSLGSEISLESAETKGGFFTTGLVEGLNGRADFNKDKVVWIHELDAYATLRTRQLSGGEQNSVTGRPPTIKPFPLSRP